MHQYAAGLIDGEGYIGIQETGGSFQVRLKIAMIDKGKPALDQMARIYGGNITYSKGRGSNRRDVYEWRLTGEKAAHVIRQVKPYLLVKAEAAEVALSFQQLLATADKLRNGRRKWTSDMRIKAKELRRRIQEANRRGIDPEPVIQPKGMTPLAKYRAGSWWEPADSLFGPEPFEGRLPTSGQMIDGVIYELPSPETDSESSSLLPTPQARSHKGSKTGPELRFGPDRNCAVEEIRLLPTPLTQDNASGPSMLYRNTLELRALGQVSPAQHAALARIEPELRGELMSQLSEDGRPLLAEQLHHLQNQQDATGNHNSVQSSLNGSWDSTKAG